MGKYKYNDEQKEIIKNAREIVISYQSGLINNKEVYEFLGRHSDIFDIKIVRDDLRIFDKTKLKYYEAGRHFFSMDEKISERLLELCLIVK